MTTYDEHLEDELTAEEREKIEDIIYGSPKESEKHSVHTFLHKVAISDDTTKTGNLTSDEVGKAEHPARSLKQFALISKDICDDEVMSKFFLADAEILTSTSLSKDAKLINLAVTTERRFADRTKKEQKKNTGWFNKKEKTEEYE